MNSHPVPSIEADLISVALSLDACSVFQFLIPILGWALGDALPGSSEIVISGSSWRFIAHRRKDDIRGDGKYPGESNRLFPRQESNVSSAGVGFDPRSLITSAAIGQRCAAVMIIGLYLGTTSTIAMAIEQ